jgi:alpha-tubulin suppressor-like RCC1 family protein
VRCNFSNGFDGLTWNTARSRIPWRDDHHVTALASPGTNSFRANVSRLRGVSDWFDLLSSWLASHRIREQEQCMKSATSTIVFSVAMVLTVASVANVVARNAHDGTVVAWGGPQLPPAGDFRLLIQGGSSQGLGIRPDGRLVLWGGSGDPFAIPPLPPSFASEVFINGTIAKVHLLGLTWDGRVLGWGSNTFGQLTPPPGVRFTAVAAGSRHSVGIALDGTLRGWGDPTLIDMPAGRFIDIAARATYTVAVRHDGTVFGWGVAPDIFATWTPDGQGHYSVGGHRFTSVSAGVTHALALTRHNRVLGWGTNADGELDEPHGVRFQAIAAGEHYSLGIAMNGRLHAWGDNSVGQVTEVPSGRSESVAAAAHNAFAIMK